MAAKVVAGRIGRGLIGRRTVEVEGDSRLVRLGGGPLMLKNYAVV